MAWGLNLHLFFRKWLPVVFCCRGGEVGGLQLRVGGVSPGVAYAKAAKHAKLEPQTPEVIPRDPHPGVAYAPRCE